MKRILIVGESSIVASGYGVIQKNIVSRFHAAGYEVAELAAGVAQGDPRLSSIPWRVYPVVPHPENKAAQEVFTKHPLNKLGKYLFEDVCLDFQPHHVLSWTDPFMAPQFIQESCFRSFFKFSCQAPVDGSPQYTDWIYLYKNSDLLYTYTDWGSDVLRRQMNNPPNLRGPAYLCADYNVFKPLPKDQVRDHLEMEGDSKIIGMVARNQPRKAFEELFLSFAKYLNLVSPELAKKSYLYLHTSYFDNTWDLEYLLNKHGLYSKVLFTYRCLKCGDFKPLFMCGPRKVCEKCGAPKEMTNTHNGISDEQLNLIYNCMDAYCQLHYLEGFGIPCLEATGAGLPLLVSDHASTKDFIAHLDALPVNVAATRVETQTHREWGIPDTNHAAEGMKILMTLPSSELSAMGNLARLKATSLYNWDITARRFMEGFEETSEQSLWNAQPVLRHPQPIPPLDRFKSVTQLVEWTLANVACRPDLIGSYTQASWEKRLLNRVEVMDGPSGPQTVQWDPNKLFEWANGIRNYFNHWENIRAQFIQGGRIK